MSIARKEYKIKLMMSKKEKCKKCLHQKSDIRNIKKSFSIKLKINLSNWRNHKSDFGILFLF